MRATYLAVFLLPFAAACGDGSGNDDPDETGDGDGDMSTGGSASGGGSGTGSQPGTGGTVTKDDHEAACRAFCEGAYTTQCGDGCPETCDGYANTYGEECAAQGVDFFNCMSTEDPGTYDCDAGNMKNMTDGCVPEEDDLTACFSVGGVFCEREQDDDAACAAAQPGAPFAFYCVSKAVPDDCSQLENSFYCCPTE